MAQGDVDRTQGGNAGVSSTMALRVLANSGEFSFDIDEMKAKVEEVEDEYQRMEAIDVLDKMAAERDVS